MKHMEKYVHKELPFTDRKDVKNGDLLRAPPPLVILSVGDILNQTQCQIYSLTHISVFSTSKIIGQGVTWASEISWIV